MPQYISGLKQFPNGYSPSNSPLSPGNYAGDDYFSSRQVTPGTASSPGGSAKIKSRPRPSTAGARISQGGIKALFGQGSTKGNRASLDLKSEAANQPTLSPTLSHQVPFTDTPKTPPARKKRAPKAVSAEFPVINRHSIATAMVVERPEHKTPSETSPPPMTLAERRAAAAALGAQRRTVSESSAIDYKPQSAIGKSLIPPRLGLDPRANRLVLSPNTTPGESGPLASPSILSTSASSPAPIQIDRITPRHSSSQTRTEEQQRQMDAAMERVNFDDVTVAELKEMLRQRGKHGGGKKAELIMRLQSEIEIIRANRLSGVRTSATGPTIPPPLASPTHALYSTLGGMHIGSPPIHATANLPNVRVTPYGPSNEQGDAQGTLSQNRGVDPKEVDVSPSVPKNLTKRDNVSPSPRLSQLGTSYISSDGTVVQSHRHQRALSASSRMELTQGSKQPSPPPAVENGKGIHTVGTIDTSFMFENLAMDTSMAFSQDEMDLFYLGPQDSHTGSSYADGFSWQ